MQNNSINFVRNDYYEEKDIRNNNIELDKNLYYIIGGDTLKFINDLNEFCYFKKNNINLIKVDVIQYTNFYENFSYNNNIKLINLAEFRNGKINYTSDEIIGYNYSFIDDSGKENSFELYYPDILTPVNIVDDYNLVLKKIFDDKIPEGTLIEVSSNPKIS